MTGIVWAQRSGAVVETGAPTIELKPLLHALTSLSPLSERWCQLIEFAAAYYQRGIGEVALSVLPPELRKLDDGQIRQRISRLYKGLPKLTPADAVVSQPEADGVAPALDLAQTRALAELMAMQGPTSEPGQNGAPTVLLHGITGSGKTWWTSG